MTNHPDLINLDTGDEYVWRGDGYAHEGDSDWAWTRADLEGNGRLVPAASVDPDRLAELRRRYAAGDLEDQHGQV